MDTLSEKFDHNFTSSAIHYDYDKFYARECAVRQASGFPPFSHILRIMVESENEEQAINTLKTVFEKSKTVFENYRSAFIYFDKMKSPVKRINNKYRYQVLARITKNYKEIEDEFYVIANESCTKKVLCYTEVNPSSIS